MGAWLEGALQAGKSAWSGVALADDAFFAYLAARAEEAAQCDRMADNAAGVYLACACLLDVEGARAQFTTAFGATIRTAVARSAPAALVDDISQRFLEKVLVGGDARPPKIAKYTGRGPLDRWVQVLAIREAYRDHEKRARRRDLRNEHEDDIVLRLALDHDDPELEHVKRASRAEFKRAFQTAFNELPTEDRNLLRYELVDGLTVAEIGRIYGASVATIARRRAKLRGLLLSGTRKALQEQLALSADELDSMFRLIDSQLEASLPRLLLGETVG